jgi:opacity protein-like surface antigen
MKKILLLLGASLILCQNSNAQAFGKGKNFVTAGYGVGLGFSSFTLAYAGKSGYKTSSFGPVLGTYEYGISKYIGVGANISYATASAGWEDDKITITTFPSYSYSSKRYAYTWQVNALQVLGRANFHIPIRNDNLDLYGGLGVGYFNFSTSWTSTDPSFNESLYNISNPIPVAFTLQFGCRYFFTNNFGAYAEVGWGLALANAGLAFKF